jgi:hypothetical protein
MGEDERRGGSGEDRISGLPDELLHDILVRLRCAQAAARTSVLSRRWRHVWAHLPELRLVAPRAVAVVYSQAPRAPDSFLDTVDGALAGYLALTLRYLSISLEQRDVPITARRVAPWLQFAAEHVVGEIHLYVPRNLPQLAEAVLELPACEGAERIELSLAYEWRLQLQASSLFSALTSMKIMSARMKGSELTSLVCTQCPCLRDLALFLQLIAVSDVSMHSNSLRSLVLLVRHTQRLEVVAPNLEELTVYYQPVEAHISAPKLVKVTWNADVGRQLDQFADVGHQLNRFSDVGRQLIRFADVGRSLRLLEITRNSAVPFLTKQFDEVNELILSIDIPEVCWQLAWH